MSHRFGSLCVLTMLAIGCGSHARDCEQMNTLFFAEPAWGAAPEQADMSNEAQARNWTWRADRAAGQRVAIEAAHFADTEAEAIRVEFAAYYDVLEHEARAASAAFAAGDIAAIAMHTTTFDAHRSGSGDARLTRVNACH